MGVSPIASQSSLITSLDTLAPSNVSDVESKAEGTNIPGMEDPSDDVIELFRFREGLVSAFMSADPEAEHRETTSEGVQGP
ncbi:hypothetical protein EIP86_006032 [Pleurotus ostreatoroseus]|nr:hypothetical protein EIP86_006032 [Pleurotus ostreatoroseus]